MNHPAYTMKHPSHPPLTIFHSFAHHLLPSFVLVACYFLLFTFYLIISPSPSFAEDSAPTPIFGQVTNPLNTIAGEDQGYGDLTGTGGSGGGLIGFISNIIKIITIIAGIYSMFNFIIAGLDYITSQGDPKGTESARNKITQSIIGLVIIVGTFAITALASRVLFGSYDAILRPTIYGPNN